VPQFPVSNNRIVIFTIPMKYNDLHLLFNVIKAISQ